MARVGSRVRGYPGSAPDIAGERILSALEVTLESGTKTRDLGSTASTDETKDAVVQRLEDSST